MPSLNPFKKLKNKIEQVAGVLIVAFIIRYCIAPSKKDEIMILLFILMPLISAIILVVFGVV